jgi:hypothetical protein
LAGNINTLEIEKKAAAGFAQYSEKFRGEMTHFWQMQRPLRRPDRGSASAPIAPRRAADRRTRTGRAAKARAPHPAPERGGHDRKIIQSDIPAATVIALRSYSRAGRAAPKLPRQDFRDEARAIRDQPSHQRNGAPGLAQA